MNTGLDVRVAIRDANEVFGRFPARICLPYVLLGLLSVTVEAWTQLDNHPPEDEKSFLYFLIVMVLCFISFWLYCFIEVVVSTMYLRAREGEEPGTKQVGEAWQYRGFASLAGGLLLRCLGWGVLVGLSFGLILIFAGIFSEAANTGTTSGVGAVAGGVGHGIAIGVGAIVGVAFVAVVTLIYCRYMFIFPMYAIERGAGRGFLDECVRRTKTVLKTAAWVQIVGMIPACLIVGVEMLARRHWTPPLGVHIAIELAVALVNGCYAAWFMLVKTGLARQLMAEPAAAIEPIGDGAAI